ncbi:uncharacterized protein LOC101861842 [Aplysia californica]|uniref:Uncharacterized protein LOC101861842 n=1 Tax=Aplysia californica TaxID=6500 RepID=A0ABM0K3S7_APLCA|nr:uncharacterized protein LOC101861842 [Aplysia californica]
MTTTPSSAAEKEGRHSRASSRSSNSSKGSKGSRGSRSGSRDKKKKNNNGTIDFDEFCRLYSKFSSKEQDRKDAMLHSIDKLFPSTDGEPVALKKVEKLLLKLQKPDLDMRLVREKSDLNEKDVKYLVRSMDADGNGYISKDEFVNKLCQHLDLDG